MKIETKRTLGGKSLDTQLLPHQTSKGNTIRSIINRKTDTFMFVSSHNNLLWYKIIHDDLELSIEEIHLSDGDFNLLYLVDMSGILYYNDYDHDQDRCDLEDLEFYYYSNVIEIKPLKNLLNL